MPKYVVFWDQVRMGVVLAMKAGVDSEADLTSALAQTLRAQFNMRPEGELLLIEAKDSNIAERTGAEALHRPYSGFSDSRNETPSGEACSNGCQGAYPMAHCES